MFAGSFFSRTDGNHGAPSRDRSGSSPDDSLFVQQLVIETPEEVGLARAPIDERGGNGTIRGIDDAASDDCTRGRTIELDCKEDASGPPLRSYGRTANDFEGWSARAIP